MNILNWGESMGVNMIVYQLVNEYKRFDEVLAITLTGSEASGKNDFFYDIDVDVILKDEIDINSRREILKKFSDTIETNSGKYGEKDIFILRNSTTQIDVSYYTLDTLKENLFNVVDKCKASVGYTTCLWKVVSGAFIAYDKENTFKNLQKRYRVAYPEKLKLNIIDKNYYILRDSIASYYNQIDKAINRGDLISVSHKICKFLDSYFDVVFAVNEMPHPGDKRLISIINSKCKKIPRLLSEGINTLIENSCTCDRSILRNMDEIVDDLKEFLIEEGIKVS